MILRGLWSLVLSVALANPPGAAVDLYVSPRGVQTVIENAIVNQVNGRYLPTNDVRLQASRLGQEDGRFRIQATAASTVASAIRVQVTPEESNAPGDRRPVSFRTSLVGPPAPFTSTRLRDGRTRDLEIRSSEGRVQVNFVPSELDIDIGHVDIALDRAIQAEGVDLDFRATRVRVKNLKVRSRSDLGIGLSFGLDAKGQKISLEDVRQNLMMDAQNLVIEPGEIVLVDEKGNERDASGNPLTPQIPGLTPSNAADVSSQISEALKAEFHRNKDLIVTLATPKITDVLASNVKKIIEQDVNPKLEQINRIGINEDMTWLVNGLSTLPDAGLAAQYCLAGGAEVAPRSPWIPADTSRDVSARLTREDVTALLTRFTGKPLQFGDMKITPAVPAQVRFGEDGRIYARFEGEVEHPALANLKVEGSKVQGNVEVPVRLDYENGVLKVFLDLPDGAAPVESTLSLRVPTRDRQTGAIVNTPINARVRLSRVANVVQARVVLDDDSVSSLVNYAQTEGMVPTVLPMGQGRTAEFIQPIQVRPDIRTTEGPVAGEGASVVVRVPQVRVPIPQGGEIAQLRKFDDPATGEPWEYVDLAMTLRAQARVEEVDGVQKVRVYLPPSHPHAADNFHTRGVQSADILNIKPEQANGLGGALNALGGDWIVLNEYLKGTSRLAEQAQAELARRPIGTLGGGRFADTVRHPDGVLRHAASSRTSDGEVRMTTQVQQLATGGVMVTMKDPQTGAFLGRYQFSPESAEGRMYLDHLQRFPSGSGDSLRYKFTRYTDSSGAQRWGMEAIDPRLRLAEHPPAIQDYVRQKLLGSVSPSDPAAASIIQRKAEHERIEMTTHVSRAGESGVRVRMIDATTGAFIHEYRYSDTSSEGRMYLEHAAIHGASSPIQYRAIPAGGGFQLEAIDPNRDGRRPLFEFSLDDPRAKPYLDLVTSTVRTHAGADVRVAQPTTSRSSPDAQSELTLGLDLVGTDRAPQVPLGEVNVESMLNARLAERGSGIVPPIGNTQLRLDPATGEVIFSGDFQRPQP